MHLGVPVPSRTRITLWISARQIGQPAPIFTTLSTPSSQINQAKQHRPVFQRQLDFLAFLSCSGQDDGTRKVQNELLQFSISLYKIHQNLMAVF